ncbi:hypothetical protein [Algoriphagus sp. NG3]|uniref:hypothetical protein n=1 Tax=unclassified Algoriphagus TaxID=2641541 RepID=UPI002A810902|nr:hypothetical protein [Algoriphagus sp. NG3]WPR75038.1 hypothetical protein SLW71_20465 [Algoriphagus sp. NG3]
MDQKSPFPVFPMHFRGILLLAGMYTIGWAAIFQLIGPSLVEWLADGNAFEASLPTSYYGGLGIVVGLLLLFSAFYPVSWVYLIIAGITGKIILAIWFGLEFIPELGWNKRTAFQLIFNEILWLIPLIAVFLRGCQVKSYLAENFEK